MTTRSVMSCVVKRDEASLQIIQEIFVFSNHFVFRVGYVAVTPLVITLISQVALRNRRVFVAIFFVIVVIEWSTLLPRRRCDFFNRHLCFTVLDGRTCGMPRSKGGEENPNNRKWIKERKEYISLKPNRIDWSMKGGRCPPHCERLIRHRRHSPPPEHVSNESLHKVKRNRTKTSSKKSSSSGSRLRLRDFFSLE